MRLTPRSVKRQILSFLSDCWSCPSDRRALLLLLDELPRSFPRWLEITQIRRRLVLFRGHEETIAAHKIDLIADGNMNVVLGAYGFFPPDGLFSWRAAIILGDDPRTGERVVDRGDFVMQHVGIGLIEIDALPDDGLIVMV